MNLHYKIIEMWPNDHLVVVRYFTDILSEDDLAASGDRYENGTLVRCRTDVSVNVPIPAPTGDELDQLLLENAPMEFLKKLEAVKDPSIDTSLSHIEPMLHQLFSKDTSTMVRQNINALSDDDIEKLIESITNSSSAKPAKDIENGSPTGSVSP